MIPTDIILPDGRWWRVSISKTDYGLTLMIIIRDRSVTCNGIESVRIHDQLARFRKGFSFGFILHTYITKNTYQLSNCSHDR